jgi:hypothetical protein
MEECEREIKDALFRWAWKRLTKSIIMGFPEWYKNLLLEQTLESEVKVDNDCSCKEDTGCKDVSDGEPERDSASLHESDQFEAVD